MRNKVPDSKMFCEIQKSLEADLESAIMTFRTCLIRSKNCKFILYFKFFKMPDFEWDTKKNESNKKKHGLSFEQGSRVFDDPNRLQKINARGTERRYLTIGKAFKVIMTVIYTVRNLAFRIISVRRSRKDEREAYLTNSLTKQDDEHE